MTGPSTESSRPGLHPPRVQAEDIGLELYHQGLQVIGHGRSSLVKVRAAWDGGEGMADIP